MISSFLTKGGVGIVMRPASPQSDREIPDLKLAGATDVGQGVMGHRWKVPVSPALYTATPCPTWVACRYVAKM